MIKGIMDKLAIIDLENTHPVLISHILDAINSAILLVDHEDRLLLVNSRAEMMFGKEVLRHGERVLEDIFMPEDRDILLPNILKLSRQNGEFEGEVMLRRTDSSTFIALMATSSWPWEDGQAVVITIHDISRLKGIEKLLKNSERMAFLGSMLDDISHQIRNPVLAIGGFSRRLAATPQQRPEYLTAITEEAIRLEGLLDALTEFIHLPPQSPVHVDTKDILPWAEETVSSVISAYDVEFNILPPEDLPSEPALFDKHAVQRAVQAVAQNCADEHQCTKELTITLSIGKSTRQGQCCTLTITDNGQGIRPQLLPRIFNPFFTTKTGHTGMGLTLAKRIIQEAEGLIEVDSTFGTGTTVSIHLPKDRRREIRRKKLSNGTLPIGYCI